MAQGFVDQFKGDLQFLAGEDPPLLDETLDVVPILGQEGTNGQFFHCDDP